jgi:zinc protease
MTLIKRSILLLFVFANYSFAQITTATLDNGLKVIIKENHKSPIFLSQIWYSVGASDEPQGITGISHMFEHMMFKGTKKYPIGQFSKIISNNGGQDNAFTSKDYTAYYQKMTNDKLDIALKLEADRMQNLQFSETEFQKERAVVAEERRLRVDDKPNRLLLEYFKKNFYTNPYQRPVIGWMDDIQNYKLEDLKKWYQQWYQPKNAVLIIIGDVDSKTVIKKVNQYFAKIKNREVTLNTPVSITKPLRKKHLILKRKAKLPFYVMAYEVPSLNTIASEKKAYALEFLSYILDKNLTKKLVRKKNIASSISVSYHFYDKYRTAFMFSFVPAATQKVEDVREAILKEIKELQTKLTSQYELTRFKNQAAAAFVYQQDSISSQAYYLGSLETIGLGWQKSQQYLEKLNEVTAQEIKEVAIEYLNINDLFSAQLIPQKL